MNNETLDGETSCFQSPTCPAGECCLAVKENIHSILPLPSTFLLIPLPPRVESSFLSFDQLVFVLDPLLLTNPLRGLDLRQPYPICDSPYCGKTKPRTHNGRSLKSRHNRSSNPTHQKNPRSNAFFGQRIRSALNSNYNFGDP